LISASIVGSRWALKAPCDASTAAALRPSMTPIGT
jgi:hypothetical protein